jgi:hypothetical protein
LGVLVVKWLTRFFAGADTTPFGSKSHEYPEEGDEDSLVLEISFPSQARLSRSARLP